MIGHQGRSLGHHQRQISVRDGLTVERAEVAPCVPAQAEAIFTADKERHLVLQLAVARLQEADHATEMVVVTVAENERVENRRVDLKDAHVVEQSFGRITEIDEDVARFIATAGFGVHGKAPLAVQDGARRRVRRRVAALALDGEAVALLVPHELNDDVVGDHPDREPVDLRNRGPQGACRSGSRAGDHGADHCGHEADVLGAEQAGSGKRCHPRNAVAAAKQHSVFSAGRAIGDRANIMESRAVMLVTDCL